MKIKTSSNFLQVSNHCSTCHIDYFGNHQYCTGIPTYLCNKCNFGKESRDAMEALCAKENKFKFCPYCGHSL